MKALNVVPLKDIGFQARFFRFFAANDQKLLLSLKTKSFTVSGRVILIQPCAHFVKQFTGWLKPDQMIDMKRYKITERREIVRSTFFEDQSLPKTISQSTD